MEKLLQLLNEYQTQRGSKFKFTAYDEKYGMFDTNLNMEGNTSLPYETVVNKKFGFIQWLVENKKLNLIDFEEVIKEVEFTDNEEFDHYIFYSIIDSLLMSLAIQDEPISFLVSILK